MPRKASTSALKKKKAAPQKKAKTPALRVAAKKPAAVAAKPAESRGFLIGLQLAIAASAIAVLVLLAAVERNVFSTHPSDAASVPATIGLEHDSPLSLSILFARKENAGYVSIKNASTEDIHLSLPSSWTKSEVTGTDIKNVTQDIPVFGFSRYALPAGGGMKLLLPSSPDAIFFDSTSSAVTAVDLKTIDLVTSQSDSRVVLVQKQSLVPLWGSAQ